jgi:uncharacterized protein (TIGR03067 family)
MSPGYPIRRLTPDNAMRTSMAILFVFVATTIFAPARADDSAPEGDLAKLQGKWSTMVGPAKTVPALLVIKGSSITLSLTTPQGATRTLKGELKLEEKATPKAMDWVKLTADGRDGPDVQSIYDINGDTLKIRGAGPGKERPTEFKDDDETSRITSMVFTREKDDAKAGGAKKDETKSDAAK